MLESWNARKLEIQKARKLESWKARKLESQKARKLQSQKAIKLESCKARKLKSQKSEKIESWKAIKLENQKADAFYALSYFDTGCLKKVKTKYKICFEDLSQHDYISLQRYTSKMLSWFSVQDIIFPYYFNFCNCSVGRFHAFLEKIFFLHITHQKCFLINFKEEICLIFGTLWLYIM